MNRLVTLQDRYNQPGRYYHNWQHIQHMLGLFEQIESHIYRPHAVKLAILWHDAVYDATSDTNEEDSAELMWGNCVNVEPVEDLLLAQALIMSTKRHLPNEDLSYRHKLQSDNQYLLDMDLSVLGSERYAYDDYSRAIRCEYDHVEESAYRVGRAAVIERFLARPRIYFTEWAHDRWESGARTNIQRELEGLRSV